MKIRICFLVLALAPLFYYGMIQWAPAGRAATVSSNFRHLGKSAVGKIETAQEASSEADSVFQDRVAEAEQALVMANNCARTDAERRDYLRLVSYLSSVKQDHILMQASNDPSTESDHDRTDAARESAEKAFN